MIYSYDGNAIEKLLQSYNNDKEPFIADTGIKFPERKNEWEEIKILKELFFPNYWNSGLITKPGNKAELKSRLEQLGQLLLDLYNYQNFLKKLVTK